MIRNIKEEILKEINGRKCVIYSIKREKNIDVYIAINKKQTIKTIKLEPVVPVEILREKYKGTLLERFIAYHQYVKMDQVIYNGEITEEQLSLLERYKFDEEDIAKVRAEMDLKERQLINNLRIGLKERETV